MSDTVPKTVWPHPQLRRRPAAIAFLDEAFGFVETIVVPADGDADVVAHAELRWPEGGGVMLGSPIATTTSSPGCPPAAPRSTSSPTTRTASTTGRWPAAPTLVREMRDEDYGSTGFSVRDPEGNLWSFGTYRGEP